MAAVKMKLPTAHTLPAGTRIMAFGYPGEVDADGFTIVSVPQHLAEHEAESGRLVYADMAPAPHADAEPTPRTRTRAGVGK